MNQNCIVVKICTLPEQLKTEKNKSFLQILQEQGFGRSEEVASIEDIENYLRNNTNLIESWLLYSMDKRTNKGWYFTKEDKKTYIVGYLSRNDNKKKESKYSNAIQACAIFIHNELDKILKTIS